jgi:hypothetical protein
MNEIIARLILLYLVTLLIAAFYWGVVQKILMRRFLCRFFAHRDELRRLAIMGIEDPSSASYKQLDGIISILIEIAPVYSLTTFVWAYIRNKYTHAPLNTKSNCDMSVRLLELRNKAIRDFVLATFLNSPLFTAILVIFNRINSVLLSKYVAYTIADFTTNRAYRKA